MFSTLPLNPFYARFRWPSMPPPTQYVRRVRRKGFHNSVGMFRRPYNKVIEIEAMRLETCDSVELDEILKALCALQVQK